MKNKEKTAQIESTKLIQPLAGQFPCFLKLTTLTNHFVTY